MRAFDYGQTVYTIELVVTLKKTLHPKQLNSNHSISSEPLWISSFFVFSTLSTNHTLSYMANPLHFACASKARIARNQNCSFTRAADDRSLLPTLKCLAAQPRNFPKSNHRKFTHIRPYITMTIAATRMLVRCADSYDHMLHDDVIACALWSLSEMFLGPDCAPAHVDWPH